AYCDAFGTLTTEYVRLVLPVFVTVTVCDGLEVLTSWLPNASALLSTMMFGRPAVHVRFAIEVPPESVSLTNVTVAVCVPLAAAGGEQRTGAVSVFDVATNGWVNVQLVPPLQPLPTPNVKNEPPEIVALVTVSGPFGAAPRFVIDTFWFDVV